jgi:mRNA-degrading endonuclease toxin of MazEF toxin-antitoxin module
MCPNVSQAATVAKAELAGRIGKLSAGALDKVRGGLQLLFDRA